MRDQARRIFETHNGILRSGEAQRLGIHPQTLARMVGEGSLIREARGVYVLPNVQFHADPDLIHVAKRAPKAVVCLLSALSYHDMTTQIPRKVYIALPQDMKAPRMDHPPLEVVWMSKKPYGAGIERYERDGVLLAVYNREKTVADCFKFRRKIGEDVALEALKDYLQAEGRSVSRLMQYVEVDRVRSVIEPYVKALL